MFHLITQKFYVKFIYPFIAAYLKKDRPYNYKGFKLTVFEGIFHPAFFFSTKYFYAFINKLPLENKTCLEVGCGTGLLSLLMLRKNGIVTSIDIQERAIANTRVNFEKNRHLFRSELNLICSDLFDHVPKKSYDYVFVNPPYYFTTPETETQQAWFCGKNGEYFIKFFGQLEDYIHSETSIYMILAENCEIDRIKSLAAENKFQFKLVNEKKIAWEKNYIFKIKRITAY